MCPNIVDPEQLNLSEAGWYEFTLFSKEGI